MRSAAQEPPIRRRAIGIYAIRAKLGIGIESEAPFMPTRNAVLTDHHEEVIDRLVKSGRYQNESEVMREGCV